MVKPFVLASLAILTLTACQYKDLGMQGYFHFLTCETSLGRKVFCTDEIYQYHAVDGIKVTGVDGALFYNNSVNDNLKLQRLIKGVLAKDQSTLKDLIAYDCGGGAGCYDLGFIFSELVYKMGEDAFIQLTNDLNQEQKSTLEFYLRAGLEYGYSPNSTRNIETSFLDLYAALQKK